MLWSSDAPLLDLLEIPAWHAQAACRDVPDPDVLVVGQFEILLLLTLQEAGKQSPNPSGGS